MQTSGSGAQGNAAHVPNNIFSYGLTGTIQDLPKPTRMQGIGGNVLINKCGILQYTAIDDDGNKIKI
jgi:hypothetical protein